MLKRGRRGQSSVEYLSIVAIALLVLIPGSYLFLNYSKSSSEQVAANQLNLAGSEIINEAEKMYILGRNSWVTLDISLPGTFINASIFNGTEMFFTYSSSSGNAQTVFFPVGFNISNSDVVSCTGACDLGFNVGANRIRIQSQGSFVSIKRI